MLWEYIKKPALATKEGLANLKATFRMPSHSHTRRKTILASIFVLTLICLAIVIEDFGSFQGFVKADSVIGIGV